MMPLTFAGVDLSPMTERLRTVADRWWVSEAPDLWSHPGYFQEGMHHLPVPAPPPHEAARLNTLYWPVGASRWAVLHALVGGEQVWWLTLVDDRYYWWQKNVTFSFAVGATTWAQLLANLMTAVGTVAAVPAVPAAYGSPSARWGNLDGKPLPLLIDAAAALVGMRFVRRLSGTCEFVTADAAKTSDESQMTSFEDHLAMGGRTPVPELCGLVPASVNVNFWGNPSSTTNVTLASLALPDYGSMTGVAGAGAWVVSDLPAGTTSPTPSSTADQAARDYYKWALSRTECVFRSVRNWVPTGFENRVEWEYMPGRWDQIKGEPSNRLDKQLPWERVVTRVVPSDRADRNVYGGDPCCVKWCSDYYTYNKLTQPHSPWVDAANPTTGGSAAVTTTKLKVPAGKGKVRVSGGLRGKASVSVGPFFGGAVTGDILESFIWYVYAHVVETDSAGVVIDTVTETMRIAAAGGVPAAGQGAYLWGFDNFLNPYLYAPAGMSGAEMTGHTEVSFLIDRRATPRYFVWYISFTFNTGTFPFVSYSTRLHTRTPTDPTARRGGTWLQYNTDCEGECDPSPP